MVEGQKFGSSNTVRSSKAVEAVLNKLAREGFAVTTDLRDAVESAARSKGLQNTDSIRKMAVAYLKSKQGPAKS